MRKKHKSYINVKESEGTVNNRKNTNKLLLLSFLGVSLFCSCSGGKSEKTVQNKDIIAPLNEEKCVNFAEQLHYSFADSNVSYMESYLNWEMIEDEVVNENSLRKEIYNTLLSKYNVTEDFVQLAYSEADIRFITYYQEDDKHYIVFRVFEQPQSLDIYEFELMGNASEIMITDIYDYNTSASLRTSLNNEVDFWSQWGTEWSDHFQAYEEMEEQYYSLMLDGNLKDAYLLTKQYAGEFTELKRFRQLYGLICENSNSPELMIGYLDDEVKRIDLMEKGRWLPVFYLRSLEGNFGEALIALSNLEKEVGQDIYIDFLKGNIYFEMGDYEAAINWFNKSLSQDANVMVFHLAKAHAYINMNKYVEAVEALLVMDDSFDIDELDWELEFAQYPNFIQSQEFKEFLSRLGPALVQ